MLRSDARIARIGNGTGRRVGKLALVAAIVCATAAGHAEVVMEPPAVRMCPSAKSWDALEKCLAKLRIVPRTLRTLPKARLVMLEQTSPALPVGAYFYVQKGSEWRLGGVLETVGTGFEALDFATIPIGARTAYRFDFGLEMPSAVQFGGRAVSGLLRMTRTMYCSGEERYQCVDVTTGCELLVRGRALLAFHGTVKLERSILTVTGDLRRAGNICAGATKMRLVWAESER